uniref:Pyrin domain-containing protein n=1 Tax=Seriola lalandi dorsalis TaxID=1841481 RepID=A0A3B4WJ13_SERLL
LGSQSDELLWAGPDLGDRELKNFKWYLQQPDFLKDFPSIPKSQLEKADRPDTVDVMVQTYSHRCVEVAKRVLKRMRRNDLVESLSNSGSAPEGQSKSTLQSLQSNSRIPSYRPDVSMCRSISWCSTCSR